MKMTEERLIRLLAAREPNDGNRAVLEQWLAAAPANQAAELLSRVLQLRPPRPRRDLSAWCIVSVLLASLAAPVLIFVCLAASGQTTGTSGIDVLPSLALMAIFTAACLVTLFKPGDDFGRKAALLFARLDRPEAVPALVVAWSWEAAPGGEYGRIEAELTRLATRFTTQYAGGDVTDALRKLLNTACRGWRRDARQITNFDLTDARADLLLAAVRYLAHSGKAEDLALLRTVAALPVHAAAPNRQAVRDTAAFALEPSSPAPPTEETATVAPPTASTVSPASKALPPRQVTIGKP